MKNKWLIALLILSLGFNLVIVGVIAGRMSAGFEPVQTLGDPTLGYFRGLRNLPSERMATIRPVVRHHFRVMRPTLREVHPAQRAVLDALMTTPFKPEELRRALERLGALLGKIQAQSHESLVEVTSQLTDAERLQLAAYMRRPQHNGPPHSRPHQPE